MFRESDVRVKMATSEVPLGSLFSFSRPGHRVLGRSCSRPFSASVMSRHSESVALVDAVVRRVGGRYSLELGIDLDAGDAEVERWFVASTLFGNRISARLAQRTFEQLDRSGIRRIVDAGAMPWDGLVALLDAGGYARYDFRTATRLQSLAEVVTDRYGGEIAELGRRFIEPAKLVAVLDDLPGWGPTTIGLFLRELRGVWRGARLPLDPHAAEAAIHLRLARGGEPDLLAWLTSIADESRCDERDLEAALVRFGLAHRRIVDCPGGNRCFVLRSTAPGADDPADHAVDQRSRTSATRA